MTSREWDGLSLLDGETIQVVGSDAGPECLVVPRPVAHTVAVLVRVPVGSRVERPDARGAAHLLEHLFLRGTAKMPGMELTKWIDTLGGVLSPFTTRELTALLVQVPSGNWEAGLDLLLDMALTPGFTSSDVEAERSVVLEELRSTRARPEQLVYDGLHAAELEGTGLDQTVIGDEAEVRALTYETLSALHHNHYTNPRSWHVVAVGDVEGKTVAEAVARHLGRDHIAPAMAGAAEGIPTDHRLQPARTERPSHWRWEGDYPYSYVGLGIKVAGLDDRSSMAWRIVDTVLGRGLSSRMVARIRDRLGWAYDVYSMYEPYSDAGLLTAFAAVAPERTDDALGEMRHLVASLGDPGIREDEFDRAATRLDGEARTSADNPPALCTEIAGLLGARSRAGHMAAAPLFGNRATLAEAREVVSWVAAQEWSSVVVQAR